MCVRPPIETALFLWKAYDPSQITFLCNPAGPAYLQAASVKLDCVFVQSWGQNWDPKDHAVVLQRGGTSWDLWWQDGEEEGEMSCCQWRRNFGETEASKRKFCEVSRIWYAKSLPRHLIKSSEKNEFLVTQSLTVLRTWALETNLFHMPPPLLIGHFTSNKLNDLHNPHLFSGNNNSVYLIRWL